MDSLINILIKDSLQRCFKVYGIEGTLETIERVYTEMPELKEQFIFNFNLLLKGKNEI